MVTQLIRNNSMKNQYEVVDVLVILKQQLEDCDRDRIPVSAGGIAGVIEEAFKMSMNQYTKWELKHHSCLSSRAVAKRIRAD
jgi:hypothetical protein